MFHNHIYYTDKPILDASFCDGLIHKFNNDDRVSSGIVGKGHKDNGLKKSDDLHITSAPGYGKYHDHMRNQLLDVIRDYQNILEEKIPVYYPLLKDMKFAGFNMQRTQPGGYYNWHTDEHVMSTGRYRGITYIIYLNTIHEMGYTEFYDGTRIQPKQGHALIFPATWTHVHRGVPPTKELKYIATGWCYYKNFVSSSYSEDNQLKNHPDIFK